MSIEDKLAIHEMIARYSYAYDSKDAGGFAQVFLEMDDVLAAIRRDGNSASVADRMASFKEREAIVDTAGYLDRDRRYRT
jgi:hypothetical protein